MSTDAQYREIVEASRNLFLKKTADYGTAWRVLRLISIIDQIYIKAYRIRTIQEAQTQKVSDAIGDEFTGIINYSVIGLMQLHAVAGSAEEWTLEQVEKEYSHFINEAQSLMHNKNHDYGEAWRQMSQESFVDLILMKLQRMRQIAANKGKTLVSEGLDANYYDMINYAVFALILLSEKKLETV